jgi:isochorismate synthase
MVLDRSRSEQRSWASVPRLISRTLPTAMVDPIEMFASASHTWYRALWLRPSTREALVGIGSARIFADEIGSAWRDLVSAADIEAPPGCGPALIGGIRFDPAAPPSGLWDGFGTSRLVLPERTLRIQGGAAWLTTNRVVDPRPLAIPTEHSGLSPRMGLPPQAWRELVAFVARGIRDGNLGARKVVLARAEHARVDVPIEEVLRRLAEANPGCTIFAFAAGEACFVGATPERLVALHDGTATTMALAGSAPRGASPEEDARLAAKLLTDQKERTEHALVVDALRDDLAPLYTRLIAEAEPRIHALSTVQHLVTPVRAQIDPDCTVLDVVARLHPTPAVGGAPRSRALELIRQFELLDRGWYAAPLGWVDARGQGEFVVGLRSALVRNGTATLFAGCGIVGDSDPETEFLESGWKLRPMQAALGIEA